MRWIRLSQDQGNDVHVACKLDIVVIVALLGQVLQWIMGKGHPIGVILCYHLYYFIYTIFCIILFMLSLLSFEGLLCIWDCYLSTLCNVFNSWHYVGSLVVTSVWFVLVWQWYLTTFSVYLNICSLYLHDFFLLSLMCNYFVYNVIV